jgi:hypothetical protein
MEFIFRGARMIRKSIVGTCTLGGPSADDRWASLFLCLSDPATIEQGPSRFSMVPSGPYIWVPAFVILILSPFGVTYE